MDGRGQTGFLGQPHGIGSLILVEAWATLSYYGMRMLLVLYMTRELLLPGHVEHVVWFAPLRAALEGLYGPMSNVALASAVFGMFSSVIFLTPLAGAFLSDRWLGRTRAIVMGGTMMVAGTLLLMVQAGFMIGLVLILTGFGLFGGNLTAQLGELYTRDDPRRGDGFQLLYLAIDAGVIVAPLICGTLGELRGFGYGFASAAGAMVVALAVYLHGRRWLPRQAPSGDGVHAARRPPVGGQGWKALLVLAVLIPVIGVAAVANNQIYGAYELWGESNYDLIFFGRHMPVTWLLSIDSLISFGCGFVVLGLWRWLEARGRLPAEIDRCAIGTFLSAGAALLLAIAGWSAHGQKVGLAWGLAFHLVNNLGVAMLFPLTLALFSRAAPTGLSGTMINASKLNFFVSFQLVGWLGGWVDKVDSGSFWAIHASVAASAGVLLVMFGRLFRRILSPDDRMA